MYPRRSRGAIWTTTILVAAGSLAGYQTADAQMQGLSGGIGNGGQEEFGHYELVQDWPQGLPDDSDHSHAGWTWGSMAGVYAESPDRIWISMRGELPLPAGAAPWTPFIELDPPRNAPPNADGMSMQNSVGATCARDGDPLTGVERRWKHVLYVVDRNGRMVQDWPQHDALFGVLPCGRGPHKIKINPHDPEKHVWVIDDLNHVIYKFSQAGELVLTLGELGVPGRGPNNFARPTDIDWFPDGTYFISDGYDGTRIAKFDANDNFLMDWGQPPADPANPGPNEWDTVHSVAVSKDRRVFAVDRGHSRIQVFDENGNFLNMWSTGLRSRPFDHIITEDQMLWVIDGGTDRVVKYDLDGNFLYAWGAPGPLPGQFNGGHQISVDQEGNLYVPEVFGGRVQKFRPLPGADPAKLVGQEVTRTWQ